MFVHIHLLTAWWLEPSLQGTGGTEIDSFLSTAGQIYISQIPGECLTEQITQLAGWQTFVMQFMEPKKERASRSL